ncbi:MAG TPA: SRPBCC family protein [Bacillales bacterium]|nr:SRPBCC family protein [Bacillales bacterium]
MIYYKIKRKPVLLAGMKERREVRMVTEMTTKMKINKPAAEVFEAVADPEKMGNYWFSSGTSRVEAGKTITWRYEEYGAEGVIHVKEVVENEKIVFDWGETSVAMVFRPLNEGSTILEVTESGFDENDPVVVEKLIDQKGGWTYMLSCLKAYLENGVSTLRASMM